MMQFAFEAASWGKTGILATEGSEKHGGVTWVEQMWENECRWQCEAGEESGCEAHDE